MFEGQSGQSVREIHGATLDVAVVAYQSEATLPALLESVRRSMPPGSRVVIWANSDPSLLGELLSQERSLHPGQPIEILGSGENLGFARACNAMAQWSDRENLLFLNPDALILNWPVGFSLAPGVIRAPLILDSDLVEQESYGRSRTLLDEFAIRVLRRRPDFSRANVPFEVGYVSGAAFLVGREDFLRIGGFDDTYFMYYEDIDLGQRWAKLGGKTWVEPDWVVKHIGGVSAASNRLAALQRSQVSAERYHQTWSGGVRLFRTICMTEAVLKAIIALITGRVGLVDRRTQFAYSKWLVQRWRAKL